MKVGADAASEKGQAARQRSSARQSDAAPLSGPLAQLAATINNSPRVQAQLKLAEEIQSNESAVQLSEGQAEQAPEASAEGAVVQRLETWEIAAIATALGAVLAGVLYSKWPEGRSVSDILALARRAGPRAAMAFAYMRGWDSPSVLGLAQYYGNRNNGRTADEWVTIANNFPANSAEAAIYFSWIPQWSTAGVGQLAQSYVGGNLGHSAQEWANIASALPSDSSADAVALIGIGGWNADSVRALALSFAKRKNGSTAQTWAAIAAEVPANAEEMAAAFAGIQGRPPKDILKLTRLFLQQSYGLQAPDWAQAAETLPEASPEDIAGQIEKMVGIYGKKNKDFIHLLFQQQAGVLGKKESGIVDLMQHMLGGLPEVMQTQGNFKNLKLALISSTGAKEADQNTLGQLDPKKVVAQWEMLRENLIRVEARVRSDWGDIQERFEIKGKIKCIHLTGSDFHNRGQSVSIVESESGQKVVYKPRSLAPDMALTGDTKSVFATLSDKGAQDKISLPTTKYQQRGDKDGEYGYMEFLERAPILSDQEAAQYYFRMGQLAVATKLLGVTDLHQDNVLTGPGAPTLIDTETSFLPYVMLQESFTSTLLESALKSFENMGKVSPNAFLTASEAEEFEKQSGGLDKTTRKQKERKFTLEKRRAVLESKSELSVFLLEGISAMLGFVKKNRKSLEGYLLETATNVQHVRIVPIDTLTFKGYVKGYYNSPEQRTAIMKHVRKELRAELQKMYFEILEGAYKNELPKGLAEDFLRLDIPLFHYEPKHEGIFYKDTMIAKARKGATLADAIVGVLDRLENIEAADVLKSYAATN